MEEENVKVVIRIRPLQTIERKNGDIACVKAISDGREIQVKVGPLDAQVYKCNKCFPNDATQATFFEESGITELLDSSIQGYRACAFAFGQTGAGKTFTMVGPTKGINHRDKQVGMIARSLEYVFHKVNMMGVKYSIKIACLEIYHEHVYDLFADEKERLSLAVREHATDGFFLEGCKMVECSDYEIACGALDVAMRNRQTGGHDMNNRSSRSHCLTKIYIEFPTGAVRTSQDGFGDPASQNNTEFMTRGRMSLVDLAGSERLKSTNSTGKVLQEAGFINRSLYVLGKVIAGLVRTGGDLNHKDVPYRDSKLTKLLISSLGGRCHTLLISCVSEAKGSQAETLRTLKFSMSCARIRNKPVKFMDPHDKLILDLRDEIKRLKYENKKLRSTILTAPASGEKSSLAISDDESTHSRHRALSAQSSLPGNSRLSRKSPAKKLKKAGMKSSQSEFFNQYGHRIKKLNSPNKHKQQGVRRNQSNLEHTTLPIAESEEEDALSYLNDGGDFERDADQDDDSVMSGSQASRSRRIVVTQATLDDHVRRQATGPMVFRGKEAILPVRDTHPRSQLANNYERSLEEERISRLERRLAKMERAEAMRSSVEGGGGTISNTASLDGGGPNITSSKQQPDVTLDKYLLEEAPYPPPAAGGGHDQQHSPSHQIVVSAESLVPKKVKKRRPKKSPKESPYIAHMLVEKPKSNNVPLPKVRTKPPKPVEQQHQEAAVSGSEANTTKAAPATSVTSLHDAIQAELEELGLADPPSKPKATGPVAAKHITKPAAPVAHKPSKPETHITKTLPVIPSERVEKKAQPAVDRKKAEKLPVIAAAPSSHQALPAMKPKGHSAKAAHTSPQKALPPAPGAKSSPTHNKGSTPGRGSKEGCPTPSHGSPSPAVAQAKKKLEVLERSLTAQRVQLEDNPGEATSEREATLASLQAEAKSMRKELEIAAGGDLGGGGDGDGYEEDPFEEDAADDYVPRYGPAVVVRSAPPTAGTSSLVINTGRDNAADPLETSTSSQDPPTPAAVKAMAAEMREINSNSAAQSRTATSVPQEQRPKTSGTEAAEAAYGDDDFEADFEADFEEAVQTVNETSLFGTSNKEQPAAVSPVAVVSAKAVPSPVKVVDPSPTSTTSAKTAPPPVASTTSNTSSKSNNPTTTSAKMLSAKVASVAKIVVSDDGGIL